MENVRKSNDDLASHLFRREYGKILAVIIKFFGIENLGLAEDIVQETFYKAVRNWQHQGIPPNPEAWLYTTAKNECRTRYQKLKRERININIYAKTPSRFLELENDLFSNQAIADEQLRMMFICCNNNISVSGQLALILKILGGFSISEIANAFFIPYETAKKRLVRARKRMRAGDEFRLELSQHFENEIPVVLQAIYLLFNEGYSPSDKNVLIKQELCFEAIRLAEILIDNSKIKKKNNCNALLSLMYLNVSRFEARLNESNMIVEMKNQNRKKWNQELMDKGLFYLRKSTGEKDISMYQILAAISANHCIAPSFEKTNWEEILSLYDSLLTICDSPIIRLNRCVVLSKVKGSAIGISELLRLKSKTDIDQNFLFHSTIAEFYLEKIELNKTIFHLNKAIFLAKNNRDISFLERKLANIVPI